MQPLSENHLEKPIYSGFVLGYGRLKAEDAPRLIAKMAKILGAAKNNRACSSVGR